MKGRGELQYFEIKVGERMKKIFGNFTLKLGKVNGKSVEFQH